MNHKKPIHNLKIDSLIKIIILGDFFSESANSCLSWGSGWLAQWAYQASCYTCPPGELLDLDTLSWVTSCDSSYQIEITDPILDNIALWRSFTYYVDPQSVSTTELGTYDHPYKEIKSAFVELFNFHSFTDRNITIKLAERTTNYVMMSMYFINITQVNIVSYSKTSSTPAKAKLMTVNSNKYVVPPGMPSMYKILSKVLKTNFWYRIWRNGYVSFILQ